MFGTSIDRRKLAALSALVLVHQINQAKENVTARMQGTKQTSITNERKAKRKETQR